MNHYVIFIILKIILIKQLICSNPEQTTDNGHPGEPLYLTKFIRDNKISEAVEQSTVKLNVTDESIKAIQSHSGYLTVNETYNSNLFFWYFVAQLDPKNAPILVWLQGGPGTPSLFGLFHENGPFYIDGNMNLVNRTYSWHLNHHLIYIDNPVGAGFSFTDNILGYSRNSEMYGENLCEAIIQFFTIFHHLQHNDLYLVGESYGGKYAPAAAYALHFRMANGNYMGPTINLKGLAIGNGFSDPINQIQYGDYLYNLGLIDVNGLETFREREKLGTDCLIQGNYQCAFKEIDPLMVDFRPNQYGTVFKNLTGLKTFYNYVNPVKTYDDLIMDKFIQTNEMRQSIHVGNKTFNYLNEQSATTLLLDDIYKSVAPLISFLLSHYRILIYTGQLDIIVPYPLVQNYLQNLTFNGSDIYRTAKRLIWKVDNDIAGYVKQAENLTDVLVRNAGHMVPVDQPKWALDLIMRLTSKKWFSDL